MQHLLAINRNPDVENTENSSGCQTTTIDSGCNKLNSVTNMDPPLSNLGTGDGLGDHGAAAAYHNTPAMLHVP
jgi:hypothetical protein